MKYFLNYLIAISIFFLLFGCRDNADMSVNDESAIDLIPDIKIERISFNQFINQEAPETLEPLKVFLDFNNSLNEKSSNENNFVIRTDVIKKIINEEGKASYTFMIKDEIKDDNKFENLVVHEGEVGYEYYRIAYKRNSIDSEVPYQLKIKQVNEEELDASFISNFLKSGTGANDCPRHYFLSCSAGGNADGHDPAEQWDGSYCSGSPEIYDFYGCDWTNDGNGDDHEDGPYDTGTTEPGAGGGATTGNGSTTSPTDPGQEDTTEMDDYNRDRVNDLDINFSPDQEDFLVGEPYLIGLLESFLDQNNSEEAEGFTIEATEAIMNNGTVNFDDQVIIEKKFNDNTCLKTIYDDMGKAPAFKNYLQNFESEFSVAHLKFDAKAFSGANAITSAPENYVITITFNTNNLNRPALSIARTFIHEMIHAEIFRKLLSVAQSPNIDLTEEQMDQLKNDYPGLHDYYMRWKFNVPIGGTPSDAQHEAMAAHYRDIIKQAIKSYDNTQTESLYDALAWLGLMGDGTYNSSTGLFSNSTQAWKNLSQSERLNIVSQINNFNSSNSNCQ